MLLPALIEALSNAVAYPEPAAEVEVRHTHISVVFLVGPYAYKIKKPVDLGFLDFTTLDKRHHFCLEEVRLNRRLAASVYLSVEPVVQTASSVKVGGPGEVIDWAVKMQRLPDEATLGQRLRRGEAGSDAVEALARKLAVFHAHAEAGQHVAEFGRFGVVARNVREN